MWLLTDTVELVNVIERKNRVGTCIQLLQYNVTGACIVIYRYNRPGACIVSYKYNSTGVCIQLLQIQ